jgi:hypothetical protein
VVVVETGTFADMPPDRTAFEFVVVNAVGAVVVDIRDLGGGENVKEGNAIGVFTAERFPRACTAGFVMVKDVTDIVLELFDSTFMLGVRAAIAIAPKQLL